MRSRPGASRRMGGWRLPLEAVTKHPAKSEGMIGPIALWRGRGCYLLKTLAQPKHDAGPGPRGALGRCFFTQLFFQASLESLGIGFFVFGCGWVREYGCKSSQFPVNGSSRSCILAYWHLLRPVIESTNSVCTKFATRSPFQSDQQRHGRLMGAQAADVDQLFSAPIMRRHMGFAFDRTNPLFSMVSACHIESP
jgi:hypothetical protein